jgi:hypothetical protein
MTKMDKLILLIFERTSNFGRGYEYILGQDIKLRNVMSPSGDNPTHNNIYFN